MNRLKSCLAFLALSVASSTAWGGHSLEISDGAVTIIGDYSDLAGIDATSVGGFLSLDSTDVEGVGEVFLTEPFPADDVTIFENSPSHIVMGLQDPINRIDIEGRTTTSILYSQPGVVARRDLTVAIGYQGGGPVVLLFSPEPSSAPMVLIAAAIGLTLRRRRRCHHA